MSKKENLESMEEPMVEGQVEETASKKWTPKPYTQEQMDAMRTGIETIKSVLGDKLSDKMMAIINATPDWKNPDKDACSLNKKTLVETFEGSDKLKLYVNSEEFTEQYAALKGISDVVVAVNLMKNYYGRNTYTAKPKMKRISIGGEIYMANAEYIAEIANDPDRREKVLAHPDTKKVEQDIEEF